MYERLRFIRHRENISAKEMAELLQLQTKAAYYKKESGLIKFSLDEAKKISVRLGMPIEEIFFDNEVSIMETEKECAKSAGRDRATAQIHAQTR